MKDVKDPTLLLVKYKVCRPRWCGTTFDGVGNEGLTQVLFHPLSPCWVTVENLIKKSTKKFINNNHCDPEKLHARHHFYESSLNFAGGYDGIFDLSSVECYNSQANVWCQVSPMKTPRCLVGVAVLNSHLFAIGGCNGQSLETVEIYSPDKNTWTIIAPMKQRRSDVGTAVVDGLLYIVGGSDGMEYLNSMEVFHPQKRKWTSSTSMQTTRKRFGCCS